MTSPKPPTADQLLWDVEKEHLREAEFLLELWSSRLFSPHYTLAELASRVELRIEAHLDGLEVGGPLVAEKLLDPLLDEARWPDLATVAALALLRSDAKEPARRVIDALLSTEGEQQEAIALALALAPCPQIDGNLQVQLRKAQTLESKAVLIEVFAARSLDPGPATRELLETGDARVQRAALTAASRIGRREVTDYADQLLTSPDRALRDAAVEAGLTFGSSRAWSECLRLARARDEVHLAAMELAALLGGPAQHEELRARLDDTQAREAVLWVLGFTGTIESGDRCVRHLYSRHERIAKTAAEALAAIGGFSLFATELKQRPAEVEQPIPLEEDDLDADLVPDGVDLLPLPNGAAVEARWRQVRGGLSTNRRYIEGEVCSPAALVGALESASMRRRHNHARELAIRTAGVRQVTTTSFATRQQRQLRSLTGLDGREMTNDFGGAWPWS